MHRIKQYQVKSKEMLLLKGFHLIVKLNYRRMNLVFSLKTAFSYALEALTSPASDWADQLGPQMDTWSCLKDIMKSKFQRLMTIQMKAELRKSLRQDNKESASDFYHRCKEAEKVAEYYQSPF